MQITFLFLGLFMAVLNGIDRVRRKKLISVVYRNVRPGNKA